MAQDWESWRRVFHLSAPYRRTFGLIGLLVFLGTAVELIEPLIYRTAINDVSGVFVRRAAEEVRTEQHGSPSATHQQVQPEYLGRHLHNHTAQPHHRHIVAPRTVTQMFTTLLWATGLLFLINVSARYLTITADNLCATVANQIEADLIRTTFGHVLRLPLAFFSRRASGALTKQVDQSDQIAPIITAFSKDIAPEVFRVIGIIGIMLTQSVSLSLLALATLSLYLVLVIRATRRLETDLPAYYSLWEQLSVRIQDALTAVKTVKLCGAEEREVARLATAAQQAYAAYLDRNRIRNRYTFWQSFVAQLGKALVLAFGGWKVLKHQLTPGDVVMFAAYLDRLYDPIEFLTGLSATLQQHMASLQRALHLLHTGTEESTGTSIQAGPGTVEFCEVHFGYVPEPTCYMASRLP